MYCVRVRVCVCGTFQPDTGVKFSVNFYKLLGNLIKKAKVHLN